MPNLRPHQEEADRIGTDIVSGKWTNKTITAEVIPGGGKTALAILIANRLLDAGVVDDVLWLVPRLTLCDQVQQSWADDRWWALDHLMLPQVEDDKAFKLFALKHDDKLRDFLPKAKACYDAARVDSFPKHINRPSEEVNGAIREFVASLKEPEELREALEREVERKFYLYLRQENEARS